MASPSSITSASSYTDSRRPRTKDSVDLQRRIEHRAGERVDPFGRFSQGGGLGVLTGHLSRIGCGSARFGRRRGREPCAGGSGEAAGGLGAAALVED